MTGEFNLHQLRGQAEARGVFVAGDGCPSVATPSWDVVRALVDAVEAAHRVTRDRRWATINALEDALARFEFEGASEVRQVSELDQALAKLADRIGTSVNFLDDEEMIDDAQEEEALIREAAAELVSRGEQLERLTRERDELQSIVGNANLWVPKRQAEARVAQLQQALEAAIELADEGWGYASPYFQEKWHVADDLTKIRAALAGVEAAEEARSAESAETRGGEQT